jgi:NAD(P)H-hydrate epimerase
MGEIMVTVKEMKELERQADTKGLSYLQMMENAGKAAVEQLLAKRPMIRTVSIFCGKGNNGGDGLVMARLLRQQGIGVLIVLAEGKSVTPDALTNLFLAAREDIPMVFGVKLSEEDIQWILNCDAVIDGIYGTGFHGELRIEGEICCGIFNKAKGFKLSLDVPSGINADTGAAATGAIKADATVVFHEEKRCHQIGLEHCGEIITVDIGIRDALSK